MVLAGKFNVISRNNEGLDIEHVVVGVLRGINGEIDENNLRHIGYVCNNQPLHFEPVSFDVSDNYVGPDTRLAIGNYGTFVYIMYRRKRYGGW